MSFAVIYLLHTYTSQLTTSEYVTFFIATMKLPFTLSINITALTGTSVVCANNAVACLKNHPSI